MTGGEGVAPRHGPEGCERAREALWPWDRPRPHTDAERTALEHVEGCPACREFFRRDLAVARAVREHGLGGRAPRELRERVYAALARERTFGDAGPATGPTGKPKARTLALVAAVVAVLGVGGLWLGLRPDPAQDAYVEDFVGRVVEETAVETGDPGLLSRFFMRELGLAVAPVSLEAGSVSRGMICLIRGRRAAMIEYDVEGHVVAHYRLPVSAARERGVRLFTERGLSVARWEDGAFEHALVSELPMERLATLARREFAAR